MPKFNPYQINGHTEKQLFLSFLFGISDKFSFVDIYPVPPCANGTLSRPVQGARGLKILMSKFTRFFWLLRGCWASVCLLL